MARSEFKDQPKHLYSIYSIIYGRKLGQSKSDARGMVMGEEDLSVFAREMYFTLDIRLLMLRVGDHRPSTNTLRPQWRLCPFINLFCHFLVVIPAPVDHHPHKPFQSQLFRCLTIESFSTSIKPMAIPHLGKLEFMYGLRRVL
jgi:hypothetical protein